MLINPYCSDRGWLFEDLRRAFGELALWPDGVTVVPSPDPMPSADVWICIRTDELDRSPDPSRTVLQHHDFWQRRLPVAGAYSFVHPRQAEMAFSLPDGAAIESLYDRGQKIPTLVQPIGARRAFALRDSMPEHFTVGWVGRNMRDREGRDLKRPHLLAEALLELQEAGVDCDCITLSPDLDWGALAEHWRPDRPGRTPSFDQLQRFYNSIDVLVVTSLPEPGPLSIYEALRCGVPVLIVEDGPEPPIDQRWVFRCATQTALATALDAIIESSRSYLFEVRPEIRASMPYFQEDWIAANIRLAVEVASR